MKLALPSYAIPSSSLKTFCDTCTSNPILFVSFCSFPPTERVEQVILPGFNLSNHWLVVPLVVFQFSKCSPAVPCAEVYHQQSLMSNLEITVKLTDALLL